MKTLRVSRYHPLLVALHWLIAVMIIALLSVGFFLAVAVPNTDPRKLSILLVHMAAGMFVFALMTVRLIVRLSTARPADAATRRPALGWLASDRPLRFLPSGVGDGRLRSFDLDPGRT